ncbi:hypothetical protein [Galactobacter valiniphilus]|uniref:hypothetical protein n=1 Tax=Galactobacter valiniphilus TaxID=2676122 RepID=UPI0038993165
MSAATKAKTSVAARPAAFTRLEASHGFTAAQHEEALDTFKSIDARMTSAQVRRATDYIRDLRRARLA